MAEMTLTVKEVGPLAMLKFFRQQTGEMVKMKPYERVLIVKINHETGDANVLIETHDVAETGRKTTFKRTGKRLVGYKFDGQYWNMLGEMVVWDEDAPIVVNVDLGRAETPEQEAERVEHERMAYRVGDSKNPMDNYKRTLDGPSPMERHW